MTATGPPSPADAAARTASGTAAGTLSRCMGHSQPSPWEMRMASTLLRAPVLRVIADM